MSDVLCDFYLRKSHVNGEYTYDRINIASYPVPGPLLAPFPPAVGDVVSLRDNDTLIRGTYRVVDRELNYVKYESATWPYGTERPTLPDTVRLIVIECDDFFKKRDPHTQGNDR